MSANRISLQKLLTMPENLYWAWEKFKAFKAKSHLWFDEGEVAYFEANIHSEFSSISSQFNSLKYRMSPVKPLPFPTAKSVRGLAPPSISYWISVRDQVAWLAFINVIGPWIDSVMPTWSYGNRLYRSTWMEGKNDHPSIKTGWYRHASGAIYRKPAQVWPLYRRQIFLTTRAMTGNISTAELELHEFRLFEAESSLPPNYKLPYLSKDYWPDTKSRLIFWASIDFETFAGKINHDIIVKNLTEFSPQFSNEISKLAHQMLDFRIHSEQKTSTTTLQDRVPKGLAVAGFLENIAMLDIDMAVSKIVSPEKTGQKHEVAHFRYNEEHVILGKSFEALERWIKKYSEIIEVHSPGLSFDIKCTKPEVFSEYLINSANNNKDTKLKHEAFSATIIDPVFPLPAITRQVEIISEMTKIKFDILQDLEKEKYISDLENLLHDQLHATPEGNIIRIDFASRNLAKFAPEIVIGSHAGLCKTERNIDMNQTRLKNLKTKNMVLIPDSDEKKASERQINEIQNKIDSLYSARRLTMNEGIKKSDRIRKRVFYTLLKALYDHPEHLSLWYRILEYCKLSGHNDLQPIHEALTLFHQADPESAGSVRAFVTQIMSIQIFECLKEISDRKEMTQKRDNASLYLKSLLKTPVEFPDGTGNSFYEKSSKMAYECSVGTVLLFLLNPKIRCSNNENEFLDVIESCRKNTSLNWENAIETWAEKTGLPIQVWIWWAETRLVGNASLKPGEVWKITASSISPDSALTWALWSKYPGEITRYTGHDFLKRKTAAGVYYYNKKNTGRLYDILRHSELSPKKEFSKSVNQVLKILGRKSFNLDLWIERTGLLFRKNIFDPRVSEWTALEIIDQVITLLIDKNLCNYPVHPANILIPHGWSEYFDRSLSWERWKDTIRNRPEKIKLRLKNLITDSRYNHHTDSNDSETDKKWSCVRGLCLLLYGLLTQSFKLPAAWNTPGHESAEMPFVRSGMAKHHVSSMTTAIIEGGLGTRQRETSILNRSLQLQIDRDTDLDPPLLINLTQLQSFIRKSKDILEKNQMTAQDNIPKQLVPVNLKHFTRPMWQNSFNPESHFPEQKTNELQEFLKLGFIQTTTLASSAWKNHPKMTRAESDHAWKQIQEGFHLLSELRSKPNIIILPELAVPGFYRENLIRISKKTGALVIAGMDYNIDHVNQSVKNQAIVIVPRRWPETSQSRKCSTFNFGKTHMAPGERDGILDSGLTFDSEQTVWIFDTDGFGKIGVCICYDFMDVERYLVYKGKIHHLIVIAYNRDIESFYHLADALSKTLFCNVTICNTGYYGGSVAVSPYYEPYNRTLYRQEGKNLFSVQVVKLPVSSIDRARKGENVNYSDEHGNMKRLFKSLPPGFTPSY